MFNERNPNNVTYQLTFCDRVIIATVIIAGLIILEVAGAFATWGLNILMRPDNDKINGCPVGINSCPDNLKMMCYYDHMLVCYLLAPFMIMIISPLLVVIVKVYSSCIECRNAYNSAKEFDYIEKVPLRELE